jgi:hypothetical protein
MRKRKPRFTSREARQFTMFARMYDRFYYQQRSREAVHDVLYAYNQLNPAECATSHAVKRAMRHLWYWSRAIDDSNGDDPGTFIRSCQ